VSASSVRRNKHAVRTWGAGRGMRGASDATCDVRRARRVAGGQRAADSGGHQAADDEGRGAKRASTTRDARRVVGVGAVGVER
jgi:hypothetical protein